MGKASREKGKRGEYFIRDWLKRVTGIEWIRTPLSGGLHLDFPWDVMPRRRNTSGTEHPLELVGIEVKNTATISLPAWVRQCQDAEMDYANFKANKWVIFSKVEGEWVASMPLEQLERFIQK